MDIQKQSMLLSYIISSHDLFVRVAPILKHQYFDPQLKNTVKFIQDYFEKYKGPPSTEQIQVETNQVIETRKTINPQEFMYAESELETFCRNKAIENAILSSPALLADGKFSEIERIIRDAISISLYRNIGVNYFADPELRLRQLLQNNNAISTGWRELDKSLNGGLNRGEMIIFAAPPGVGKSLTMANLCKNLMKQHLNGCFITLELSEEITSKRFDSMFSGLHQTELVKNITEASIKIINAKGNHGSLQIKRMPESSTNASHIRSYIKEYQIVHGYLPDFLVIDYLDLMCPNQTVSLENTFIRDKFVSEEIRGLAHEFNTILITASQLNRGAQLVDSIADINQAHTAGGISKVNTTDNYVSIYQDQQMKARGVMGYKLLKTRSSNGVGNIYYLKFNHTSLCLTDIDDDKKPNPNAMVEHFKNRDKDRLTKQGNSIPFQI